MNHGFRGVLLWSLATCLFGAFAWASPILEQVDGAREAILDGEFETAHDLLDDAEKEAPKSSEPVLPSLLSRIQYYRGILEYFVGDREVQALEYFKAALVHDTEFQWDEELVAEDELQDLFELLRREVNSRHRPGAGVPVAAITEKIYIDGRLMTSYDDVVEGRHLVQVMCADGDLESKWVLFGNAPDYGCFCSISECFRPSFAGGEGGRGLGGLPLDQVLLGGGGALLLAGSVVNFALLNPKFSEIQQARANPSTVNRAEADALTASFQQTRALTLGLVAGGTVLGAAGGALWWKQQDVQVGVGADGFRMNGRF
jgi:hypothetical protein